MNPIRLLAVLLSLCLCVPFPSVALEGVPVTEATGAELATPLKLTSALQDSIRLSLGSVASPDLTDQQRVRQFFGLISLASSLKSSQVSDLYRIAGAQIALGLIARPSEYRRLAPSLAEDSARQIKRAAASAKLLSTRYPVIEEALREAESLDLNRAEDLSAAVEEWGGIFDKLRRNQSMQAVPASGEASAITVAPAISTERLSPLVRLGRAITSRALTKGKGVPALGAGVAALQFGDSDGGFQLPDASQIVPWAGAVLSALSLWRSMAAAHSKRLINDTPVSKAAAVFFGFVELEGTAEAEKPVTTYLTQSPAVYYSYSIEERWTREVEVPVTTETTDDQGNQHFETHMEKQTQTGWDTVGSGGKQILFYLKDETGVVRVDPENAKIKPITVFSREVTPGDPLYYGKGPLSSVNGSDHVRTFVEQAIPIHTKLFVAGKARERKDIIAPEIAHEKGERMFLISTGSKKEEASGYGWKTIGLWITGLALGLAGIVTKGLLLDLSWPDVVIDPTQQMPLIVAGASYLGATLLGYIWMVFNSLAELRNDVSRAWSEVEIELQRRHDLIPNLVAAAQGLAQHESAVQNTVALLNSQLRVTAPGLPGPDPQALSQAMVSLRQRYPSLTANEAFLNVEKALADTEQRIALARNYFNDIAANYNIHLKEIPNRWIAWLGGHKPRQFFEANGFERAPEEVKLAE